MADMEQALKDVKERHQREKRAEKKRNSPKEGKHAPSADSKPVSWPYFNQRNVAKTADKTRSAVYVALASLGKSYSVSFPKLWCTAEHKFSMVERYWDDDYFRMWWLCKAVDEVGFQLWNAVYHANEGKHKEKKADEALARYVKEMR